MQLSNLIGSWFGFLILVGFVGVIFALKAWYGTPGGQTRAGLDRS